MNQKDLLTIIEEKNEILQEKKTLEMEVKVLNKKITELEQGNCKDLKKLISILENRIKELEKTEKIEKESQKNENVEFSEKINVNKLNNNPKQCRGQIKIYEKAIHSLNQENEKLKEHLVKVENQLNTALKEIQEKNNLISELNKKIENQKQNSSLKDNKYNNIEILQVKNDVYKIITNVLFYLQKNNNQQAMDIILDFLKNF